MKSSPIWECAKVPSDTIQFHRDQDGRIWLETNTQYAGKRTKLVLSDNDTIALRGWLEENGK